LALAFAAGAKKSIAGLAAVLPRLRSHYDRLLEGLGRGQGQAGAARGIGYALEREILHHLPDGKSAQLFQVAKIAVDLQAISGFKPFQGVDVLMLEFRSHGQSHGRMELAIYG